MQSVIHFCHGETFLRKFGNKKVRHGTIFKKNSLKPDARVHPIPSGLNETRHYKFIFDVLTDTNFHSFVMNNRPSTRYQLTLYTGKDHTVSDVRCPNRFEIHQ